MSKSWDNKKVLVVEPSIKYQTSHAESLDSLGMEVVGTASNGVDCLRLVKELQPDLVTLDVVMDTMDGIECAKILAKDHPNTHFIFITKMTQDKMLHEALKTNFSSWLFMSKPLDLNQLQFRLDKVFEGEEVKPSSSTDKDANQSQPTRPSGAKDPRLQSAELKAPRKQALKAS